MESKPRSKNGEIITAANAIFVDLSLIAEYVFSFLTLESQFRPSQQFEHDEYKVVNLFSSQTARGPGGGTAAAGRHRSQ